MYKKYIVALAVALFCCACQESLEDKCARECKVYTKKNCPAPISMEIILDSMTFEASTHTISYHYMLTGRLDSPDALNKENARAALLGELKNTTTMRDYKEQGYNFQYIYHSQKQPDVILLNVHLTENDYKQKSPLN